MDDRAILAQAVANGVAQYLLALRTNPLTKAQIAIAFHVSVDYVGELLATIPGVRKIGSVTRKHQYTIPMVEMPITYQLERGFSELFEVLHGFSRNAPKSPGSDVGRKGAAG
jgi:hypothetical protein